jgi:hypothetical protein
VRVRRRYRTLAHEHRAMVEELLFRFVRSSVSDGR